MIAYGYSSITNIEEEQIPSDYSLYQNFPNPFNPNIIIKYAIPTKVNVSLRIFDVLGNKIATLVNDQKLQSEYEIVFDGSELTSGIYFCLFQAGFYLESMKMVLLK